MKKLMAKLQGLYRRLRPSPAQVEQVYARDGLDSADLKIIERVRQYTLTGNERIQAALDAVKYCVQRGIPGAFAECGVWRGGSVLAMILKLQEMGVSDRNIYLYDTFEGMTEPSELDVSAFHPPALETWNQAQATGQVAWEYFFNPALFSEGQVRSLLANTGYPAERLHFIRGRVEDTIPAQAPPQLALLRLDTDWYESTRHELLHLYPRIADGGVLIIDDYGHWQGCRQAVDEYFASGHVAPLLLGRIDYTGRIAIKH